MGAKYQQSFIHYGLATVLLLLLALSPFLYRAWFAPPALRVRKVAVLTAFSGQLQARGADAYAAAQMAQREGQQSATGARVLYQIAAMDDRGRPEGAADQARSAGADRDNAAVLCCSTDAALDIALSNLPGRTALLSLQFSAAAIARAEVSLAAQQFGAGTAVLLSDVTIPADSRRIYLQTDLQQAGFTVTAIALNFATGSLPSQVAEQVAAARPHLVVLDADYPAAAWLGPALRAAGVAAPLLGDDRLDGAEATRELSGLDPWWYVAPDRSTLLRLAPAPFGDQFAQGRGHEPSSRDVLTYLQARAAFGLPGSPVDPAALPTTLYAAVPGVYPGQPVATARPNGGPVS